MFLKNYAELILSSFSKSFFWSMRTLSSRTRPSANHAAKIKTEKFIIKLWSNLSKKTMSSDHQNLKHIVTLKGYYVKLKLVQLYIYTKLILISGN